MVEGKKETILFVDDEESILEIASEYFLRSGYEVITATDGLEAVEALEDNRVDCCFTDINMPGMDGLELAEHIRTMDNTIPVIIMTGFPSLDNTLRTLKNGVVDFLIKPVNLEQMEICVQRVLRERRLFVDNILLKKELEGKERLEKVNRELAERNHELGAIRKELESSNLELGEKVDDLNVLNSIMTDFTTVRSTGGMFRRMVNMSLELAGAERSAFFVINEELNRPIEIVSSAPGSGSGRVGEEYGKFLMDAAGGGSPLIVAESGENAGLPPEIGSFMAIPLAIRDKVIGLLTASSGPGGKCFTEKELYYLSMMTNKAGYAVENLFLYENISRNLVSTLKAFVSAVEAKDAYTKEHSTRVAEVAVSLGAELGCTEEEMDILQYAGQLHDIGKIGVSDAILTKPAALTDEEYEDIKQHPVIGAGIVGELGLWDRESEVIRHHHERFDGNGYPDGLSGEGIPYLARILSVADAFDAMDSNRSYRKKFDSEKIRRNIEEGRGTQFDPVIADAFLRLHGRGAV